MSDSESSAPSKTSSEDRSDPDFMPPPAKKSRVNPSSASGKHPSARILLPVVIHGNKVTVHKKHLI